MSHDSSISINTFRDDALSLSAKEFEEKNGRYFLICDPQDHTLSPTPWGERDAYKGTRDIPDLEEILASQFQEPDTVRVYVLGTPSGDVKVGRAKSSQVCIDDVSLSSRHALLSFTESGDVMLTDLGSRNGSSIGNEKLEFGSATKIPFGKNITLGAIKLTLLETKQFVDLVKLLAA